MNTGETRPAADPLTEVAFTLTDSEYPFVRMTRTEECRFELVRMLPRDGERYAEFFSIDGADPATIEAKVADAPAVESELLADRDSGGLFEFVVSKSCPVVDLAERGAIPTTVVGDDGTGFIRAQVPTSYESSTVVAEFLDEFPSATLVAKRETDHPTPLLSGTELQHLLAERLTERQREVLETAFENGYYERPRTTTGQELAAQLDISVATFSQHIRAAERKLLALLYESRES